MSRPMNVSPTQQLHDLKRTHHEPTLTLQLASSLQSRCLWDGPIKSE